MSSISLKLGYKYLKSNKGGIFSFTTLLAIVGLSIGISSLIVVTSVMNGFEKELQNRILGVIPHSVLVSNDPINDYELLIKKVNENKEYIASFVFDISSNTEDITGSIQHHNDSKEINKNTFVETLELFKGKSTQTPPKFSAKKINGVPMYKLARAGKEFEVKPQNIEIFNLELIDYDYPKFTFKTLVSKGTYIRTLGVDIAKKLGKFCCLTDLQRTRIGSIKLKESIDINTLKSLDNESKMKYVKRIEEILRKFPKVSLSSSEVKKFQNGSFVRVEDQKMHSECFVFFKDELLGYGLIDENKNLQPKRVINRRN